MKNNKLNICIIRHAYYPGDVRVYKEVRALCEAGYSVDVICLRKPGEQHIEIVNGVRVYRLPHGHRRGSIIRYIIEYGLSFFLMPILLTIIYFRRFYTLIQVNTMPDALVFITLIPRFFGAKVLLDMHEPIPELMKTITGRNDNSPLMRLLARIEQAAIRYADAVLTVNSACKEKFIERGAAPAKITIIRNVPPETFAVGVREASNENFVLMTHGCIERRYGHETMIRALPLLKDKIPNLQAYIIGEGEDKERLRRLSRELDCSDILVFTGFVPVEKIGEFLSQATIGIVPLSRSAWGELAQPNKLFEYILYRKPVVVSRLRAIQESFDDSCVAFFDPDNPVDLTRAVMELWRDESRRQELERNSYRQFQQMQWATEKEFYLRKIRELTQKRNERIKQTNL